MQYYACGAPASPSLFVAWILLLFGWNDVFYTLLPPPRPWAVAGWGRNCRPHGLPWYSGCVLAHLWDRQRILLGKALLRDVTPTNSPWGPASGIHRGKLTALPAGNLPWLHPRDCSQMSSTVRTKGDVTGRLLRLPHGLSLRLLRGDDTATDRLGCPMSIRRLKV